MGGFYVCSVASSEAEYIVLVLASLVRTTVFSRAAVVAALVKGMLVTRAGQARHVRCSVHRQALGALVLCGGTVQGR